MSIRDEVTNCAASMLILLIFVGFVMWMVFYSLDEEEGRQQMACEGLRLQGYAVHCKGKLKEIGDIK